VGRVVGSVLTRRRTARRESVLAQELPVLVDVLGVAIGAGCTPYLAVEVAARWAPPVSAEVLTRVQRDCALGVGFAEGLDRAVELHPSLVGLTSALLASDRYGAPVGDALERVAAEERAALRRRAEARARTVPVRLLFPLVFLVLPAFALLTVIPALLAGLSGT
jgi:tight adherence protein C